jgi:hypothetical protein
MSEEAHRDRVERWIDLPAKAETVWALIGPFGGLAAWHPSVSACRVIEVEGETHRHLTLADEEHMLERLTEHGPHHYRYEILEGPLPVENYRATLTCFEEPGGCRVFWSSTFDADDPEADHMVAGIYEAGLRALQDRFGGG